MTHKIVIILLSMVLFLTCTKNTKAQLYCEGDSVLLNALDYVSGDVQWQVSPDNNIWYDIQGATALTHTVYPSGTQYYRLLITDTACLYPYSTPSSLIIVTSLPTHANAGNDQLNVSGTSINLNANTPIVGSGLWTIVAGTGGSFNNANSPNTLFIGNPNIPYLLRWTISNACGSSYDEVNISFSNAFTCGSDFLDVRDAQLYPTLLIGNQCWFKKNLNYGQQINSSTAQTNNSIPEKYCYDNTSTQCDYYGGMYQWDEAMHYSTNESVQGLCPTGWHIPSDNEFKILEVSMGMSQAEADLSNTWRGVGIGTALKLGGFSGFDVLLGGGLWGAGGSFLFVNSMSYIWTSTQSGGNAWRRCFSATDDKVGRWDTFPKNYGFNVRCVKD